MYSELIKWLLECASGECFNCSHKGNASCPDDLMKQAADAIERLDAIAQTYAETVHEIEDKRKWIPVTERLPENHQRCLVFDGRHQIGYFAENLEKVDEYDLQGKNHHGWYYLDSEWGYCEISNIMYWMPLPQPPESGEA